MRTACLTDDEIACLSTGLLTPDERVVAERHLDVCPVCSGLLADLGRTFGQPSLTESDFVLMSERDEPRLEPGRRPLSPLAKLQLSQALVLTLAFPLLTRTAPFAVSWPWWAVWFGALITWSLVNSVGFARGRHWAARSAKWAAIFALVSVVTSAHAVYTWRLLSERRAR